MSTCKPQKHPKNTVKTRLIIFSVLAVVLVVCAFFSAVSYTHLTLPTNSRV